MSDSKTTDSLYIAFMAFLKQNKLRETYERRVVAQAVASFGDRFDIDSLTTLLAATGEHISRATIYNTITLLIKSTLIVRQQFDSGQCFYEIQTMPQSQNRFHLVCTTCGKVSNVRSNEVRHQISEMKFGTFIPDYITMSVYGTCSRCQRQLRRDQQNMIK